MGGFTHHVKPTPCVHEDPATTTGPVNSFKDETITEENSSLSSRSTSLVHHHGYRDRAEYRRNVLRAIRIGLKYFRTIKKCDVFVFVSAFIDFLTSSKKYVIPAEVTRNIILEGVPSTFESISRGATIAIRSKNPSEVLDITGFSGFTSPAPADCRGSEDPRKVQDTPVYGPAQASASSAAVTNQLIAGGDCASAEQSIGSVSLPPSVPVSCETTADENYRSCSLWR